MAFYVDTSALVKLIRLEAESEALRTWYAESDPEVVTNDLTRTELLRVVRRREPGRAENARTLLDAIDVLPIETRTYSRAALLEPPTLRSLDALHLASALDLGDDLDGFVTYDDRLAEAARAYGITVVAPI